MIKLTKTCLCAHAGYTFFIHPSLQGTVCVSAFMSIWEALFYSYTTGLHTSPLRSPGDWTCLSKILRTDTMDIL